MLDFALGEMGLKPAEFWDLTWPEYDSMRRGYFLRNERQWDQTRHLMTIIHNMNCAKGKQLTPERMIKLSFDKKRVKQAPPTDEEINQMLLQSGFQMVNGEWKQMMFSTRNN